MEPPIGRRAYDIGAARSSLIEISGSLKPLERTPLDTYWRSSDSFASAARGLARTQTISLSIAKELVQSGPINDMAANGNLCSRAGSRSKIIMIARSRFVAAYLSGHLIGAQSAIKPPTSPATREVGELQ